MFFLKNSNYPPYTHTHTHTHTHTMFQKYFLLHNYFTSFQDFLSAINPRTGNKQAKGDLQEVPK